MCEQKSHTTNKSPKRNKCARATYRSYICTFSNEISIHLLSYERKWRINLLVYMYVHKIVCIILFVKWTKMSRITKHILGGVVQSKLQIPRISTLFRAQRLSYFDGWVWFRHRKLTIKNWVLDPSYTFPNSIYSFIIYLLTTAKSTLGSNFLKITPFQYKARSLQITCKRMILLSLIPALHSVYCIVHDIF